MILSFRLAVVQCKKPIVMTTTVHCPQCQKAVVWEENSIWKPFCCERCKLIDLGEWAEGNHRIAGPKVHEALTDDSENFDYH